jgi:AraC-like DNA-binding protein
MSRFVFDSDDLAPELPEEKRRALWIDLYSEVYGTPEIQFLEDRRFRVNITRSTFGGVSVGQSGSTASYMKRSAYAKGPDICYLIINRGPTRIAYQSKNRPEIVLENSGMVLASPRETREARFDPGESRYDIISMPRARLRENVTKIGDFLYQPTDSSRPAARLLRHYLDIVGAGPDMHTEPALVGNIETTLVDLVSLVLDGNRDTAAITSERGIRTARIQAILAEIKRDFSNPLFSPETVATKLGLSTRYVQDLLTATGANFTERVLELRLRHAQQMLADPRHDGKKVSDIALACGFNDISYFNRRFRARFGCAPTQYRNGPRQI